MFITFEGPDGSGKTTILNRLIKDLNKQDLDFVLTREPGAPTTKLNKKIREIIIDNESIMTPMTEAILFSADRRFHLDKLIIPSLNKGKIVLCDRYFDSTFAYQGAGRGLGIDKMINLQENITDNFYPHLTFYFDVSINEAIKRVESRGKKNRLDNESKEFMERVHKGYKEVIKRDPKRFVIIDANKNFKDVYAQVLIQFTKRVINKMKK